MTFPKRQHWVPRFYLRHFKVPNADSGREQVWIFHRRKGEPRLVGIENIAVENYLYSPKADDGTRDSQFEKKLADLENTLATIWPELATGFVNFGAGGFRKAIALFLSVQFLRHPEHRQSMRDHRKQLVDLCNRAPLDADGNPNISSVQIGANNYPLRKSDWESFRDAGIDADDRNWLDMIEEEAITYAEMFMAKRWSVVFIDQPLFVTSDYPVFVPQPHLKRSQIGGPEAIIMFPICPTRILCMDDLEGPQNQYFHLENNQADLYNCLTWVNTDSFMISPRNIDEVLAGIIHLQDEYENDISKGGS